MKAKDIKVGQHLKWKRGQNVLRGGRETYQDWWPFWLDDACYRIVRGVSYLALPSEVDADFWCEHMQIEAAKMTMHHGVLVRAVGDDVAVEIQLAKHQWVFDLLDRARQYGGEEEHMVIGVLLGYSGDAIEQYLHDVKRTPSIGASGTGGILGRNKRGSIK